MGSKYIRSFALATAIPLIILLLMTVAPVMTLLFGSVIYINTEPYDPRDLFRGDHVVLNYKINNIEASKLSKDLAAKLEGKSYLAVKNKKLYALLKKEDSSYDIDYLTDKKPINGIYLKCRLEYYNPGSQILRVDYNLDKYFVPENTGKALEDMSRSGELTARIKVFHGYALLVEVLKQSDI